MKAFLLILLATSPSLHAQTGDPRIQGSQVEQRLEKARMHAMQKAALAKPGPGKGSGTPVAQPPPPVPDLIASSDILCYNGNATLVPKRAILHQPPVVGARVNQYKSGSKLLSWLDFYSQNRGWITTVEVTRSQAQGKEALDSKAVERFRKGSNLVVATFQGGPISVNPTQAPETGTAAAATQAADP